MKHLLICISFYFVKEKYIFLKTIIENFLKNYNSFDVIIDTNNEEAIEIIKSDFEKEFKNKIIQICLHKKLSHEHFLAWQHRNHILDKIKNYEVFMYIEDDILLPFQNYKNYLEKFEILWPHGIPSFVRIEFNKNNEMYNVDSFKKTKLTKKNYIKINKHLFVCLDNPYHGFWIMPRKYLEITINQNFNKITKEKHWIREIAASYGLKPGSKPYAFWKSLDFQAMGFVEIDEKYQISPLCYSYHLPNKYVYNNFNFGKMKLKDTIKKQAKLI